ncbi:MAG: hypothetical protein AUK27_01530 [Deltaproteobacteria bacterium CG2_30_66_27]|nr:MAG: hypothetical protein AUK27_01530 [Deltaproteobacteria bacterium CG2_30_66_27]
MHHFRRTTLSVLVAGTFILTLTGCSGTEGLKAGMRKSITTPAPPASPVVEKVPVKADEAPSGPAPANLDYEVGVGDVLAVMVYGRPDLSTGVTSTGLTTTAAIATRGSRVDGSGNIHLPLAGTVHVSRLSGKEEGVDAEIVFTGLRPGEKLHEELIVEGEDVSGTAHPKVMKLIGNEKIANEWGARLEELIVAAKAGDRLGVVEKLDALVKGYHPMYEFHGGPENPRTGTFTELPPLPFPPSKSVH